MKSRQKGHWHGFGAELVGICFQCAWHLCLGFFRVANYLNVSRPGSIPKASLKCPASKERGDKTALHCYLLISDATDLLMGSSRRPRNVCGITNKAKGFGV